MGPEMRDLFVQAIDALASALDDYSRGKKVKDHRLVTSGQDRARSLQKIIDEVEVAVQKRLRFGEA
jgi:hypothetical protein